MRKTILMIASMITAILISSVVLMTTIAQLSFSTSSNVGRFTNMTEEQRILVAQNMTGEESGW
jgi:hypothetical protein